MLRFVRKDNRTLDIKQKRIKKIKLILAALAAICIGFIFVFRAATTGITYDEAYTYLAYARPLIDCPTIGMVESIFYGSVANNHWLNTFLIAFLCKTVGIQYNEFLIRLPSVLSGCIYLAVVYHCYKKEKLNGIQFVLLTFCYYLGEFFGLARGYGMATALVCIGLLIFEEWVNKDCQEHILLVLSVGMLILSAYANSVTLVVCFCIGVAMAIRLFVSRQFFPFLKKWWWILIIYAGAGFVITKYHFRVSAEGMPLFAADKTGLLRLMKEYVSMLLRGKAVITISSILLLFLSGAAFIFLTYRRKMLQCDLGLAAGIYFLCLLIMDKVFGRGGFYGRTLLPAYPLVALGIYQLLEMSVKEWKKEGVIINKKIRMAVDLVLLLLVAVMYVGKVDLLRTRDWYDDYNIKTDFYSNPDFVTNNEHASVVFYEEKKEWDFSHLLQEYSGQENNSYD